MTAHTLTHEGPRRTARKNDLVLLGWAQFWLLGAILAGMLALVGLVLVAGGWLGPLP